MEPQCWSTHPKLIPHELLKKRGAMAAVVKRTRHKPHDKVFDYTSPGYDFQGMALTYQLPSQETPRRFSRTPQPSQRANESAAQKATKQVQFMPVPVVTPIREPTAVRDDPLTTPIPSAPSQDVPGVPEKYAYTERMPQSFPYGFLPSSLELGTNNQQHPPSYLLLDPSVGDKGPGVEAPLEAAAQLKAASDNLTELVAELQEALWRKATDQEKHFPQQNWDREGEHETIDYIPAVPEVDLPNIHCTPMYIDNIAGVLDVNGYVPKGTILDTGATKVMINKTFAAALKINTAAMQKRGIYVTASGSVEQPLGVTKEKLCFTLGRNSIHCFMVELVATVVDTQIYDVLLGM